RTTASRCPRESRTGGPWTRGGKPSTPRRRRRAGTRRRSRRRASSDARVHPRSGNGAAQYKGALVRERGLFGQPAGSGFRRRGGLLRAGAPQDLDGVLAEVRDEQPVPGRRPPEVREVLVERLAQLRRFLAHREGQALLRSQEEAELDLGVLLAQEERVLDAVHERGDAARL